MKRVRKITISRGQLEQIALILNMATEYTEAELVRVTGFDANQLVKNQYKTIMQILSDDCEESSTRREIRQASR